MLLIYFVVKFFPFWATQIYFKKINWAIFSTFLMLIFFNIKT